MNVNTFSCLLPHRRLEHLELEVDSVYACTVHHVAFWELESLYPLTLLPPFTAREHQRNHSWTRHVCGERSLRSAVPTGQNLRVVMTKTKINLSSLNSRDFWKCCFSKESHLSSVIFQKEKESIHYIYIKVLSKVILKYNHFESTFLFEV